MTTPVTSSVEERTGLIGPLTSSRSVRRPRPGPEEESPSGARFFLSKPGTNGDALELGREFSAEGEARVEALKAGVTYFSLEEWRPVADFAGKNPELKREAVTRKAAHGDD